MHRASVAHAADVDGWRKAARTAISRDIPPESVAWVVENLGDDLLASEGDDGPALNFSVPRRFLQLAEKSLLHKDSERFALMYRLLWRVRARPNLLDDAVDPDIWRATRMAKAVQRDIHKMHAFVRFKEVDTGGGTLWLAWFEPDHHVLAAAAPHFVERFAALQWSILTPERSMTWDGRALTFGPGAARSSVPTTDRLDGHWQAYYRSIFNPARLKVHAMKKEMPKKYWRNLSETAEIPDLIRSANARSHLMVTVGATEPSPMAAVEDRRRARAPAAAPGPEDSLSALETCARCAIGALATQAVRGEGPDTAELMIVGEQPGDQEDLVGRPFVGPAGEVLNAALESAGLDRASAYVTNAVKHFKFEPRGKRRLHKTPTAAEIDHCRWWLSLERGRVKPRLIIALGASAARSVTGKSVTIGDARGRVRNLSDGSALLMTVHPSYLLRLSDPSAREAETQKFISDLKVARVWLRAT